MLSSYIVHGCWIHALVLKVQQEREQAKNKSNTILLFPTSSCKVSAISEISAETFTRYVYLTYRES